MSSPFRTDHFSRREFVGGVSALGAVWLTAAACARDAAPPPVDTMTHAPAADAPAPPQQLVHFSADQAADIDAVASRIIPTTDTPGAHEAGVVFFIDRTMTTFAKEQAPMFDRALVDLRKSVQSKHGAGATFAKLTGEQQDALLKGMENTEFFGTMRFATIAGFLSLPKYGGNKDYIGWNVVGQEHVFEYKPPFGWYDRPENQQALLGRVL
ncbi:MAG: gluconate 2-dehydrogenase subunit 3 family protein [Phycisphaerae bacterium]|nr:gluconate 2-dehydrogenase subunit 3 family protein [Gemmatimonadaceae bacterium]